MKLAAVRFTERVAIPRVSTQQSFTANKDVSLDLSATSRVVWLRIQTRGGKLVTVGVPLERVLSFEPADDKEASAKGA